jgi:hypothetical protein
MQLTERDLTILAHVARHRFLSSAQLIALDGGSPQNLLRALRLLFDHGFLDRPTAQLANVPAEGPRPFVYGLGKKGAQALHEHGHRINGGLDWTEKNKRAGNKFIAHTLEIADFMTRVEVACRLKPDIELVREHEILAMAPERTQKAREPLRWLAESRDSNTRQTWSVVPDGLFGLMFPDDTAAYFLLEIDRGTIPISRYNAADHRSISRKLQTYYDGWKAQRHVQQLGLKQVRVLTVTDSKDRVRHMVEVVEEITGGRGSNFFLFGDRASLMNSDPLGIDWTSGTGRPTNLID